MAQVTGSVTIQSDGLSLRTKEGATLIYGGKERTPQYASGRLIGYSEAPIGATVSATLAHTSDTDLAAIARGTNVTLVFQCDSGPQYVVREAFLTSPPELTADGGDVAVEWTGQPAELV